jgi:gliding motility-associated-like protein
MRNSLIVILLLFISISDSVSQVTSSEILGISCYNDTGYIFLEIPNNTTIYKWELQEYNDTITDPIINSPYYEIDYSLYNISTDSDSISTTFCGRYRVSLFDATTSYEEIFIIPCPVSIGLGQDDLLCYGDSSGVLYAPTYGGVILDPDNSFNLLDSLNGDEYFKYQWFKADSLSGFNEVLLGDTGAILLDVNAGYYKSIVTDAIGCTDTLDYFPFNNPIQLKTDSLLVNDVSCANQSNGSILLSVSGGKKIDTLNKYFYYLISNNDTIIASSDSIVSNNFSHLSSSNNLQSLYSDTILIENLASGQYNLSVVDSFGCNINQSFIVNEPSPYIAFSSTLTPLNCLSDSVWVYIDSVAGGNDNYLYYWMDSPNNSDSLFVKAGEYSIIINDTIFGCIDTLTALFDPIFEMNVSVTIQDALCYADSSGSINIDSIYGGNSPYSVEWGGVDNNNLFAGNYVIEIVDAIGCQQFEYFQVNQNSQLYVDYDIYNISCFGFNDGSVTVEAFGGTAPYYFQWLNGTGAADSIYGLSEGNYFLQVTDNFGCQIDKTFSISAPDELLINFANFSNPLPCFGQLTTIDAVLSGGTGPYTTLWNNGVSTLQNIISAGFWSCDIIDDKGCSTSENVIIIEPNQFFISDSTYSNPKCDQGGSASVLTSGGTLPIEYLWSTGETTSSISDVMSNVCWVIATDSCGNMDSVGFNFMAYNLITDVSYIDSLHESSINVSSLSTANNFSFEWLNELGDLISTDSIVINLCEGLYFINTKDIVNGCIKQDTLEVNFNITNSIFDIETTTVFPDSMLWGFPPYSYLWDNGVNTQHANLCAGAHWVEVTDNDGCFLREDFTIDNLSVLLDPADAIIECDLENLDIELGVTVFGGTDPYTYLWANGSTDSTTNLAINPGPLSVQVMDNNACTLDTLFTITAMTPECVPNVFTPNNDNVNDTWDLEKAFIYDDSEVNVYGRFGKKIFESIGYGLPWDGTNNNGKEVPQGAYFYHIDLGNGFAPIKGTVTILR